MVLVPCTVRSVGPSLLGLDELDSSSGQTINQPVYQQLLLLRRGLRQSACNLRLCRSLRLADQAQSRWLGATDHVKSCPPRLCSVTVIRTPGVSSDRAQSLEASSR